MWDTGHMLEKLATVVRGPICAECGRRHDESLEHCEQCGKASPFANANVFCFRHMNTGNYSM